MTAVDRVARFAQLLASANDQQNLVSPSTLSAIWRRHLIDSAQLALLDDSDGTWLDIGSGGGLPGLVLALLLDRQFVLCEPRRLRVAFLTQTCEALGARNVTIAPMKVQALQTSASTISARAVAGIEQIIAAAHHCATVETCWILPRGKSGRSELQALTRGMGGKFHVKQSLTDPEAVIVVASGIGTA